MAGQETKMKFNNHIPLKILIVVGVLLIAAGVSFGYWIAQYDDLLQAPSPEEQYKINKGTTAAETLEGWELFSSRLNGFEFQYPHQFTVQQDPAALKDIDSGHAVAYLGRDGVNELTVSVWPKIFDPKKATWPGDNTIIPQNRIKALVVSGKTAYQYTKSTDYGTQVVVAIPTKNNQTVYFVYHYTPDSEIGSPVEYKAQLLSTFKFIK